MSNFGGAYFGDHTNLFDPIGERPITINEQPVHEPIRMMQTFIAGDDADDLLEGYEQICPASVAQWTEEEALDMFTDGNSVFHRNWPYSIVINGDEEVFGEDLGVMPLPYGVEEGEAEYEEHLVVGISRSTPTPSVPRRQSRCSRHSLKRTSC